MLIDAFKRAFTKAYERGWDKIYVAVDIHETIIRPNYQYGNIPTEFYPDAKKVMQYLSSRSDICLIMSTCSWPEEIEKYLVFFAENNINFVYVNKNPEVVSKGYGCYDVKQYLDVLVEDKGGFCGETDWTELKDTLPYLHIESYT